MENNKKLYRRVRFFVSDLFLRHFADKLVDNPPGQRSQSISEVLRDWDGQTRVYDKQWRGSIELRVSLKPDVFLSMRQIEAQGLSRHEWFMQAFACYVERNRVINSSSLDEDDDDELTPKRLEYLRQTLLSMRASLTEQIQTLSKQNIKYEVGDEIDHATSYQDIMERHQKISRAHTQLREVEAALVRMEQGEYGYCEKTGEPIGWRRLKANPVARLSIYAQERTEWLAKTVG